MMRMVLLHCYRKPCTSTSVSIAACGAAVTDIKHLPWEVFSLGVASRQLHMCVEPGRSIEPTHSEALPYLIRDLNTLIDA